MKKQVCLLIFLVLLAGCGRGNDNKASAHLGNPSVIQIMVEGNAPVTVSDKGEIKKLMAILRKTDVRLLSVEEELNLVFVQGKTLNATELRFKDVSGKVYKALLLDDDSLLVVDGARGESGKRREVYLSAPAQKELAGLIQNHLKK